MLQISTDRDPVRGKKKRGPDQNKPHVPAGWAQAAAAASSKPAASQQQAAAPLKHELMSGSLVIALSSGLCCADARSPRC